MFQVRLRLRHPVRVPGEQVGDEGLRVLLQEERRKQGPVPVPKQHLRRRITLLHGLNLLLLLQRLVQKRIKPILKERERERNLLEPSPPPFEPFGHTENNCGAPFSDYVFVVPFPNYRCWSIMAKKTTHAYFQQLTLV